MCSLLCRIILLCSSTKETHKPNDFSFSLQSLALPYATSVPDDVAVRVGEVIRLQCLAHGTPPLTYVWTKLDGDMSPRAQVSGGDLQINLAAAKDTGSYKCVASNKVGKSEVVAKVTVRCEFTKNVPPPLQV